MAAIVNRPPLPQSGDSFSGLSTQIDTYSKDPDIAARLAAEPSLAEGLIAQREAISNSQNTVTRRQEFATTGQGKQIYDVLSDPNKVMTGLDPNSNLKQGIDIRSGYEKSISDAAADTTNRYAKVMDFLLSIKDQEEKAKDRELDRRLKYQELGMVQNQKGEWVPDTSTDKALTDKQKKDVDSLRAEYMAQGKVNEFVTVKNAYNKVATAEDTAAGDLALIFNFMKLLDPGSTVREGEFANAQNSGSIPENIRNIYNKAATGQRLQPQQRATFRNTAVQQFNTHVKSQKQLSNFYKEQATKRGLNPEDVVGVLGDIQEVIPESIKMDDKKQKGFLNVMLDSIFGVPKRPSLESFNK